MNNLSETRRKLTKEDYNNEPVFYCKQCLSLLIRAVPGMADMDYCNECNSTNVEKATIEEWERLYEQKYGYKLLDKPRY